MTEAPYPPAPVLEPLMGTLLDGVAAVREVVNIGWLGTGADLYRSFGEMTFGYAPTFPCDVQPTKDLDNVTPWVSGFRFGAYGGMVCKLLGDEIAETDEDVRKAFLLGESTAVEAAFMATRLAIAAGENVVSGVKKWDDPVDITPAGGAVKPKVGVALLEGWMARRYVGRPVIHVPTVIASLLLVDALDQDGKMLRTKLGSLAVNGAGYDEPNTGPDGTDAAAGEKWLYATGAVKVDRSPLILRSALDQETNDYVRLAERIYIGSADGPTAAVRVQVTA